MPISFKDQLDALDLTQLSVVSEPEDAADAELPDPDHVRHTVAATFAEMLGLFTDTSMASETEDVAWGFVNIFHKAAERQQTKLDRHGDEIRMLLREQDGSEIADTELQRAIVRAHRAEACMGLFETMREQAATIFHLHTNHSWRPIRGGRSAPGMTAALIDGQAFLRTRSEARRTAATPVGTPVVFSGGRQRIAADDATTFADNLFRTLDRVRDRVPDMVLVHGGDGKGVDRFAAGWAERNRVQQLVFNLDQRLGNRAGFKRNEQMLDLKPRYVIALAGSGVTERLVETARQRRITVVDRRGDLCTPPKAAPSAQAQQAT